MHRQGRVMDHGIMPTPLVPTGTVATTVLPGLAITEIFLEPLFAT
jgi:hypothetical protein